jgi:hypothetical protein
MESGERGRVALSWRVMPQIIQQETLSVKIKALVLVSSLALFAGHAQAAFSMGTDPASSSSVVGTPAAGSKFSKIKVGMYSKEVMDLIGPPTDQKSYATGKAWIPFHFGGDNYRMEFLYKGEGSLTFSGGGVGSSALKLIRITVNTEESGYVH